LETEWAGVFECGSGVTDAAAASTVAALRVAGSEDVGSVAFDMTMTDIFKERVGAMWST
jgi:hypothetical protein